MQENKEQSNDKKKNFLQAKVAHMKDALGQVATAVKNVKEFHSIASKSIKANKDKDRGR